MARNKSGGFFGKALEFIGLVDEEDPQDYEEEYQDNSDSDPYGYDAPRKKQAEPRRAAAPAGRTSARQTRSTSRQTRTQNRQPARQTGYQARNSYDYESRENSRRGTYDEYQERPAQSRASYAAGTRAQGSRYSYENVRRAASEAPREAPAAAPRETPRPAARRPRTVMYSMRNFEDCREVIQHLISGNTVVLTLEEMDGSITQRALDTLSGAVFALSASIRRASDNTYLLAPGTVDVNDAYDMEQEF